MSKAASKGGPKAASSKASASAPMADDTIRKLNQIINLIDCPKDLNDSGVEVWGNSGTVQRGRIEDSLAIMIAQLFVDSKISANAETSINQVFGRGNTYKVIGDDKPKMTAIISGNDTIRPYLDDRSNKVEIVRLKHSTGAGGGLSGFYVCQDNGPSDVIVNPIYLITGGSVSDPASRTTSGENVRYLFPGWNGMTQRQIEKFNDVADKLPGKYINMLKMEDCIDTNVPFPIRITEDAAGAASSAAGGAEGWKITIQLLNKPPLEGKFNHKMQAVSREFAGNDTKNKALATMIMSPKGTDVISIGKRFLLAKELGDTLQVLWLKYICDLEGIPPPGRSAAAGPGFATAVRKGGQRGGAVREEKYDYANTCVCTTDIPLKWRAIVNGVGVVHTGKDGTFYYKPRGELTPEQKAYVDTVLKEKLRDEMVNHNESVMNAIQDVIFFKSTGTQWIGDNTWSLKQILHAREYLTKILESLKRANNTFRDTLSGENVNGMTVENVKDYTSTRYFISPFIMKKDKYHSLRCVQPIYQGIPIRPFIPNNFNNREEGMQGGANPIFERFIERCIEYATDEGFKKSLRERAAAVERERRGMNAVEHVRGFKKGRSEAAAAAAADEDEEEEVVAAAEEEAAEEAAEEEAIAHAMQNATRADKATAIMAGNAPLEINKEIADEMAGRKEQALRIAGTADDNQGLDEAIDGLNQWADRLYAIFNKNKQVPQPRDQKRIPWAILGEDETNPLFTRQMNQYLRKTMISNTNDTFSPYEQMVIDHNDSCYRVLIRNIVEYHRNRSPIQRYETRAVTASAAASINKDESQEQMANRDDALQMTMVNDVNALQLQLVNHMTMVDVVDALQLQLVNHMKRNDRRTRLTIPVANQVIPPDDIKAPFNTIFIFYYVSIYHPEIFTFGTMMSIGLLNFRNFEKEANEHFSDDMAHFDDDGLFHDNKKLNDDAVRKCISMTKICIKYTRYFIEKYPQVATQSLKLFINLFTHRPLSDLLINRFVSGQDKLRDLNIPTMSGGANEIDLLPLATDIAINMYELHYSLRIKAAYSDRKMEDLYMERGIQIAWYNEAIQSENDPYRLAILEYERHILCKQFIELPVVKKQIELASSPQVSNFSPNELESNGLSNGSQQSNQSSRSQLISVGSQGGRLKKTRKNRKLKKLKQSYKKSKAALCKSRKH
jgi:hypothetical protein